jgi:hypothetical protein
MNTVNLRSSNDISNASLRFSLNKNETLPILKSSFIPAFLVSFFIYILGISNVGLYAKLEMIFFNFSNAFSALPIVSFSEKLSAKIMLFGVFDSKISFLVFAISAILVALLKLLVINPIEIGAMKFFSNLYRTSENDFSSLHFGFSNNYIFNVRRLFRRDLFLFFWLILSIVLYHLSQLALNSIFLYISNSPLNISTSAIDTDIYSSVLYIIIFIYFQKFLLFLSILPFVNALLNYKWVPYIIAEDTGLSSIQTMYLSKKMVRGFKVKIF